MTTPLNRLELALLDPTNANLDSYLEVETTAQIRADIEAIRSRATLRTAAGELKARVLAALESIS